MVILEKKQGLVHFLGSLISLKTSGQISRKKSCGAFWPLISGVAECKQICNDDFECNAFSIDISNNAYCYFKHLYPGYVLTDADDRDTYRKWLKHGRMQIKIRLYLHLQCKLKMACICNAYKPGLHLQCNQNRFAFAM